MIPRCNEVDRPQLVGGCGCPFVHWAEVTSNQIGELHPPSCRYFQWPQRRSASSSLRTVATGMRWIYANAKARRGQNLVKICLSKLRFCNYRPRI